MLNNRRFKDIDFPVILKGKKCELYKSKNPLKRGFSKMVYVDKNYSIPKKERT
jgi:hypothetical protein